MPGKESKLHWESIYNEKKPQDVSWFQKSPTTSLSIISSISDINDRLIDIGGGASVLVDHLLKLGYLNLAVLDISGKALEYDKIRLGEKQRFIEWYENDITEFKPPHKFDIWHDRAVFHFLTDIKSRLSYINTIKETIKSGGFVIIATFAKDGPTKCSGLDIVQYDNYSIQLELGDEFKLLESRPEIHLTPAGKEQRFIYFVFQYI